MSPDSPRFDLSRDRLEAALHIPERRRARRHLHFTLLLAIALLVVCGLSACDGGSTAPATCPKSQQYYVADTARTASGYIVSIADFTTCRITLTVKDSVGP